MNKRMLQLGLVLWIALSCMTSAHAQVSYHAFEAVANERLSVELQDGERLEGDVRHIDEARVVLVSASGDVHEIALENVARLRVVSAEKSTSSADTSKSARAETDKSSAPEDTTTPDFDMPFSPVPTSGGGYLSEASTAQRNPFQGTGYTPPRHGLVLTQQDYAAYQKMISQSRVKRVVGWSFFATGVAFLMVMVAEVHDARQWGVKPRVGGLAAVGAVTSLVGLPIAIAGRQQYKRAGELAEQAAAARAKIEEEKRAKAKKRRDAPRAFDVHTSSGDASNNASTKDASQEDTQPAPAANDDAESDASNSDETAE